MTSAHEVSFELERFEWTADDRLEVLGRWNGLRGRPRRPALTVDSGGRRHRLPGTLVSDDPWRATFPWDGGEVMGAELEMGRTLVVELPPPRRRRRRTASGAEAELRAQVEELRAMVADLRAERAAAPSAQDTDALAAAAERHQREASGLRDEIALLRSAEAARDDALAAAAAVAGERDEARAAAEAAAAERDDAESRAAAAHAERDEALAAAEAARAELAGGDDTSPADELAGLRLAHGSLRAAHERLEDELEDLRRVREERDALAGELERARAEAAEDERARAELSDLVRQLQERAAATEQNAERRVEAERASTTEVHARLASAREETQRTIAAEAEETERLRGQLSETREDTERELASERAEVARLREELMARVEAAEGTEAAEASRRMVERMSRDLDRERAKSRLMRRELEALRAQSADTRRAESAAVANGTPAPAEPAARPARAVVTPETTRRRVDAARHAASARVPKVAPSPLSLWAVRIAAALVVALLGVMLVVLVSLVT